MTMIQYSVIPDTQDDYNLLLDLMDEFESETGIEVKLKRMSWGKAWPELMSVAMQGQGPDISHVGSTWISSLATMNALRPFTTAELASLGGADAFLKMSWQSPEQKATERAWAIPWSAYTYLIAYRKDLLQGLEVDFETAFSTSAQLLETVRKLNTLADIPFPWVMPLVPSPYNDLIHMAASWIWSMNGHFSDQGGQKMLFGEPPALQGFAGFVQAMQQVKINATYIGSDETMDAILQGKSAAVITDVRAAMIALQGNSPLVSRLGFSPILDTPWYGGGNIVIWRHTQGSPERLQAALKLLAFLTRHRTLQTLASSMNILPARIETLNEIYTPSHPLSDVIHRIIQHGRSYRATSLWHRIEYLVGQELGTIIAHAHQHPAQDCTAMVEERIVALARRMNLAFSG
jgi:ABC-type glycerol-3-phosphate transport system substrate-binding protein